MIRKADKSKEPRGATYQSGDDLSGDKLLSQWKDWLDQYTPRLFNYAKQQTRTEQDAEDVLQDSVARMWKFRDRCPDGVPALSFAYQTIRCRAIDLGRQQDRRTAREDVSYHRSETDKPDWFAEDVVENRERAVLLKRALRQLPSKLREVIELKIWGGLTFAQIAKRVGAPLNTVTSRYRYALSHLRREFVPIRPDLGI